MDFKENMITARRASFVAAGRSSFFGGGHENGALRGAGRS